MGCGMDSKSQLNQIEQNLLVQLQYSLGFYRKKCQIVDFTMRKYSKNSIINSNHWSQISSLLKLQDKAPYISDFYENFKSDQGLNLKRLLIVSIILSGGTAREKLSLLFDIVDPNHQKFFYAQDFLPIFNLILNLSIELLPDLANSLQTEDERKMIKKYVFKLKYFSVKFKPYLLQVLLGSPFEEGLCVSREAILANASNPLVGIILRPTTLRSFLMNSFKSHPQQKIRSQDPEIDSTLENAGSNQGFRSYFL